MPELIGSDVLYRKWGPPPQGGPARGVFLLVHGLGAQSSRWRRLADQLAGSRAGRRLFARLPLADKAILEYPGMLHALSIDLGREKVFRDIRARADRRL